MDIKVDSYISEAIDRLIEDQGITLTTLAEKTGVSSASITKWRRVGSGITSQKWQRLFALIQKYLPPERIYINDAGQPQYSSAVQRVSGYFFEPKFIPQSVPLLALDKLRDINPKIETASQLGTRLQLPTAEYRPKHPNISDVIAIEITDNFLAPVLPAGAVLFVTPNVIPKTECLVVAMGRGNDKSPVVGIFYRSPDRVVMIESIVLGGGALLHANEQDVDSVFAWILPVLHYEVIAYK